ncbi:uncharacterized protein LOC143252270 isoform X3 [Tachypleus tridentatus]
MVLLLVTVALVAALLNLVCIMNFNLALIIAFSSSFVDEIFYSVFISPDGSLNGILNFTLSDFNISEFSVDMNIVSETYTSVEYCNVLYP